MIVTIQVAEALARARADAPGWSRRLRLGVITAASVGLLVAGLAVSSWITDWCFRGVVTVPFMVESKES